DWSIRLLSSPVTERSRRARCRLGTVTADRGRAGCRRSLLARFVCGTHRLPLENEGILILSQRTLPVKVSDGPCWGRRPTVSTVKVIRPISSRPRCTGTLLEPKEHICLIGFG